MNDRDVITAEIDDDIPLSIVNQGDKVVESNYWQTKLAQNGMCFLTINAGTFRLLIPELYKGSVPEMETARVVVVSQPEVTTRWETELLFDDYTERPFAIHLGQLQTDRILPKKEAEAKFAAYVNANGKPTLAFERPAVFRIVPTLPWLKSLDNQHWKQFSRKALRGHQ